MRLKWLLAFICLPVWAHQTSLTSGGKELFWANPTVPIQITSNTSDISSAIVKSIIRDCMNQWNTAGSVARMNEVSSSLNEIKFVSNYPYGSAVLGLTEISYNASGSIQKAVISLNDDYQFRSSPGLYGTGQVYLGDVVTHELGHLAGLSHSEVLNSSMFYSAFSGQSTVALDDRSGIRQKYNQNFGKITGHVQGGNHVGVLGAQIQAISMKSGESSAVITDENGYFELGGLDLDDTYYLYTAPIKNPISLPGYFANVQSEFCPAAYKGSFFSSCGREFDGKPQGITLTTANSSVDVGIVSINCSLRSDEDYSYQKIQSSFAPVSMYNYLDSRKPEQAFVGWFKKPTSSSWSTADLLNIDLSGYTAANSNKYLKIALISFPFGTQLQYEMDVRRNGVLVTNGHQTMGYNSSTQTYMPDMETYIQLDSSLAQNNFEVSVMAKRLESYYVAQTFPSATEFSSSDYLPYLVVASLWEYGASGLQPILNTGSVLSDNYSCLDAPFTYAVSKTQEATQSERSTTDETVAATGCGTIEPPGNGPGSSMPLMVLGFLLALLPTIMTGSRKKFLS